MDLGIAVQFLIVASTAALVTDNFNGTCPFPSPQNGTRIVELRPDSVSIQCDVGYFLTSGEITLTCNTTAGVWNDTVPHCQHKVCHNITLGQHMASDVETGYAGDYANVSCGTGFGFNNTEKWRLMACTDDDTSPYNGTWDISGECEMWDCGELGTGEHIFVNHTGNTTFGSTLTFTCHSGYVNRKLKWGIAECSDNGVWETDQKPIRSSCTMDPKYVGCHKAGTINTTQQPLTSQTACVDTCLQQQTRYAALSSAGCFCANDYVTEETEVLNEFCNFTCPEMDYYSNMFCGGFDEEQAVYVTMDDHGCYSNAEVTSVASFEVLGGDVITTCAQLCLALNTTFAVYDGNNGDCSCSNQTVISATQVDYSSCLQNLESSDLVLITNLAKTKPIGSSCEDLFSQEIRVHGTYRITSGNDTIECKFLDGTECDAGWIGFKGSCYYFENDNDVRFEKAQLTCLSMNSSISTILTQKEQNFINLTLFAFSEYREKMTKWYIGLVDPNPLGSFSYTWIDGSLLQFSNFSPNSPGEDKNKCAAQPTNELSLWDDVSCNRQLPYICKKNSDLPLCMTMQMPLLPDSLTRSTSSLTECVQFCNGKQTTYAAIRGTECSCVDNLPTDGIVERLVSCESKCSGNTFQYCGGTASNTYTVMTVKSYNKPHSCEELQTAGISDIEVSLHDSKAGTVEYCDASACPKYWVDGNSSCYIFFKGSKSVSSAVQYCSKYEAYLAVPSDSAELNFLYKILQNAYYQGSDNWRLGIKSTGFSSGIYRTSSGEKVSEALDFGTCNMTYVHLGTDGFLGSTKNETEIISFICEKSKAYRGCFLLDNETQAPLLSSYKEMSVVQCIETCRANSYLYAMISPYDCFCAMALPQKNSDECKSTCISGQIQPCGSSIYNNSVLSVYQIDMYQVYSDCMDLYNAGIRLSGVYITDIGTTMCNFLDNSTTCDEGWVGYRDNCYIIKTRVDPSLSTVADKELCERFGGRQGTILDRDMHEFIIGLIKGSESAAAEYIRIGLVDWAETLSPTWVSGILTGYNAYDGLEFDQIKTGRMLWSESQYEIFEKMNSSHMADGVLCEKETDFIGCFLYEGNATSAALSPGEMELTLCKQTCLAKGYPYVMIRKNLCFCSNGSDFTGLQFWESNDDGNCDSKCFAGFHQKCGGSHVVKVYKVDTSYIAESCDQLYKHRILHNGTYLINSSGQIIEQNCGFSDDTVCDSLWLGLDGYCFDFRLQMGHKYFTNCKHCIASGGYTFTPNIPKNTEFVSSIIKVSQAYDFTSSIWIGSFDRFHNEHFLSGDGRMVHLPQWNASLIPDFMYVLKAAQPDLHSLTADKIGGRGTHLICEQSPGYLGCLASPLVGTLLWSREAVNPMSVTTCQQLCIGQNASFAAVNTDRCTCYSELGDNKRRGDCLLCPGYSSQPCGHNIEKGSESVFRTDFYLDEVYESCMHLYRYGVTEPSVYRIKPSNFSDFVYVRCFSDDESLIQIPNTQLDTSATSTYDQYESEHSTLTVFAEFQFNAWIPEALPGQYITLISRSHDDYIITGISTQGLQYSENWWTTSFSMKYKDADGVWKDIILRNSTSIQGNADKLTIVTHFFPDPIITHRVRVYPITWHEFPALRIGIHGQLFADYNYSTLYIGCYVNIQLYFNETNATSFEDCRVQCKENQQPFFSFYNSPEIFCSCGRELGIYGKYPESYCFPEVNSEKYALPLYKTYEMKCEQLSVNNSVSTPDFRHQNGSYTVTSSVIFTCDTGYLFPDGSKETSVTCLQNNLWSSEPNDCNILSCSNLSAPAHGRLEGGDVVFASIIRIICDSSYIQEDGSDTKVLECVDPGEWNDTYTDCIVSHCELPPVMSRASLQGDDFSYNSTITYTCDAHARTEGNTTDFTLRCSKNGTWEPEPYGCFPYECEDPPSLRCGTVARVNSTHARYDCNYWHHLSNGLPYHYLECLSNLTWDKLNVTCDLKDQELAISERQARFSILGQYSRLDTSAEIDHNQRCTSFQDCAVACMRSLRCVAYSFNRDYNVCRLYSARATMSNLLSEEKTKYFELADSSSEFYDC